MSFEIDFNDPFDDITIDDLLGADERTIQKIVLDFDYKELSILLSKASGGVVQKIKENISENLWDLIDEEMSVGAGASVQTRKQIERRMIESIGRWVRGVD